MLTASIVFEFHCTDETCRLDTNWAMNEINFTEHLRRKHTYTPNDCVMVIADLKKEAINAAE